MPIFIIQSGRKGHDFKLMKRRCHSQLRANFFSFRVVNLWNRLPSDVVSAPSVNAFKSRLDNCWKDFCYTLDPEDFLWWHTSEQPKGLNGLKSRAEDKGKFCIQKWFILNLKVLCPTQYKAGHFGDALTAKANIFLLLILSQMLITLKLAASCQWTATVLQRYLDYCNVTLMQTRKD